MGYFVTAKRGADKVDLNELTFGNRYYTQSLEYRSWAGMKDRCLNPKNKRWNDYGGRGITICKEWIESFYAFHADMGKSNGMSLDRIDVNGNYEPGNCRWSDIFEQARNRRNNRKITAFGEERLLTGWARLLEIDPSLLIYHLKNGKTIEQIAQDKIPTEKPCPACGSLFLPNRPWQVLCGEVCSEKQRNERRLKKRHEEMHSMFVVTRMDGDRKVYARLYGKSPNGRWRSIQWYPNSMLAAKFSEREAKMVSASVGSSAIIEQG